MLGALGVAGLSCKHEAPVREPAVRALCFSELPSTMRVISPAVWKPEALFQLLINGYDPATGKVPLPPTDCMGTPILWQDPAPGECSELEPRASPLPIQPLTVDEMVITEMRLDSEAGVGDRPAVLQRGGHGPGGAGGGHAARAGGAGAGDAEGAAKERAAAPGAIGGIEVLLVDGERCWGKDDPKMCQRMVRIDAAARQPVRRRAPGHDGGRVHAAGEHRPEPHGHPAAVQRWVREYEYTAALTVAPDGIHVAEQITAKDSDPRQPSSPVRLFRKAQDERLIQVNQSRMAVDRPSVWTQLLEPGATEVLP